MFQKAELARLQEQKQLLVMQADVNRARLAVEWQRLRSPATWANEAVGQARRHPVLTTVLAAAAGVLVGQAWRKPGGRTPGLGRLGEFAATALSVWKLLRRHHSAE